MDANSPKVQSVVEHLVLTTLENYSNDPSSFLISDLYIQTDPESGELSLFDEQEKLIGKEVVFDWVDQDTGTENFQQKTAEILKRALSNLTDNPVFDNPVFVKPFHINLTDDQFNVVEELFYLDDDTFRLDDPMLKNISDELNNFLDELLSDMN